MAPLLFLLLFLINVQSGNQSIRIPHHLSVQRGRSVTIPCFYGQKYKDHVKYWCRGYSWPTCTVIACTDSPHRAGEVSITDDPAQQVFTVTLRNLQTGDTGTYNCGARPSKDVISGESRVLSNWDFEAGSVLQLTITEGSPGLSVLNNIVVGEEGGSVSIQCLYSNSLRDRGKMWCRSGDWSSCLTAGKSQTSQHASVLISDDRRGVLTVTVGRLERKDTGWYWCTAGEEQFPVHITVKRKNATILVHKTAQDVYETSVFPYWLLKSAVALVYITCTIIATLKIWTYCKESRGGSPGMVEKERGGGR
ncbi:hypothetical protein MATL_G00032750 [Megalops atlanticus]|uniref:Ig-like domain-containing protein n=1 Tax=Megalops atlanticus TaxID=7932 RepID=A0A9D3TCF9_MEGAT|nr:hypothetical protein MATL_G00032750 [Megalops atlanticus]